jgi:hypothetical protein
MCLNSLYHDLQMGGIAIDEEEIVEWAHIVLALAILVSPPIQPDPDL